MDLKSLTDMLTAEWAVLTSAPIAFAAAVVIVGTAAWKMRGMFGAQEIANLKSNCDALRDRLSLAREANNIIEQRMPEIANYLRAQSAPKEIQAKAAEVQSANNAVANATLAPVTSMGQITTGPPPPIKWDDHFGTSYTGGNGIIPLVVHAYLISGKVTSTHEVHLQDAYLVSDKSNARLPLTIATATDGYLKPDQINTLPPDAFVTLRAEFNPPIGLSADQLLEQWGPLSLYAVCDGVKFQKKFDLAAVEAPLSAFRPTQIGPRATKKSA
jgi:hypothetical protein